MPPVHELHLTVDVLGNIAFAIMLGVAIVSAWPPPVHDDALLRRRQTWLLAGAVTVYAAASIINLWVGAAMMSGAPLADAGSAVALTLTQTHFGGAWLGGAAGWLLLCGVLANQRRMPSWFRHGSVFALLTIIALSHAAVSHAADAGDGSWPEWMQTLHLMLISAWSGTLLVAVMAILPGAARHADGVRWSIWCRRLSSLATFAIAVIALSGTLLASRTIGVSSSQWTTAYGEALTVKLALIALALILAGVNRWHYLPRIRRQPGMALTGFTRIATLEALVLVGVHVMAAVLAHTMPAISS